MLRVSAVNLHLTSQSVHYCRQVSISLNSSLAVPVERHATAFLCWVPGITASVVDTQWVGFFNCFNPYSRFYMGIKCSVVISHVVWLKLTGQDGAPTLGYFFFEYDVLVWFGLMLSRLLTSFFVGQNVVFLDLREFWGYYVCCVCQCMELVL